MIELDPLLVEAYRRQGFVKVPNLISREEAFRYRELALAAAGRLQTLGADTSIFAQYVNVWRVDPTMAELTLDSRIGAVATQLAGKPLRIWHDQMLIKHPGGSRATEYHQDQPYWPHLESPDPISCWIALGDVRPEAGCMTFLPEQHHRTDLIAQNLADSHSLFDMAPELQWGPRITVPLQAGDATFHHGRCPHMATPNLTDQSRVAHVIIYMDAEAKYSGAGHVVTDGLRLQPGDRLDGDLFPLAHGNRT